MKTKFTSFYLLYLVFTLSFQVSSSVQAKQVSGPTWEFACKLVEGTEELEEDAKIIVNEKEVLFFVETAEYKSYKQLSIVEGEDYQGYLAKSEYINGWTGAPSSSHIYLFVDNTLFEGKPGIVTFESTPIYLGYYFFSFECE